MMIQVILTAVLRVIMQTYPELRTLPTESYISLTFYSSNMLKFCNTTVANTNSRSVTVCQT